jgi:hypothetical protein
MNKPWISVSRGLVVPVVAATVLLLGIGGKHHLVDMQRQELERKLQVDQQLSGSSILCMSTLGTPKPNSDCMAASCTLVGDMNWGRYGR